jgi:C1A family cysteine protease
LLVGLLVAITQATPRQLKINYELNEDWEKYKMLFGKHYEPNVETSRRLVWEENVRSIERHNLDYKLGKYKYNLGVNEFSDLTHEEYVNTFLQRRSHLVEDSTHLEENIFKFSNNYKLSDSVDWRTKNYVTPVRNQKNCSCGYAFASVGALEGQFRNKTGDLLPFSVQQIIDCSYFFYGNLGCYGGALSKSFAYMSDYDIEEWDDYPFTGQRGSCVYDPKNVREKNKSKGFQYVARGLRADLLAAVANIGPIAAMMDASQPDFLTYKGGIYNNPNCSTTNLNHGVLVVGYGSNDDGDYWIIKNSYGTSWGIRGYMLLSRDATNMCGIASMAAVNIL